MNMSIENMKKIADSIEQNIEPDDDLQVIEVLDLLHRSKPKDFCTDRNLKLYDTDLIMESIITAFYYGYSKGKSRTEQ